MSLRPLLSALLLSLLLAGPAAAEEGESDSIGARFRAVARTIGDGLRPTPLHPIHGLHASVFPIPNFGIWAQSFGFCLSRRITLYDFEGGAAWLLDEGVRLTASYRMLGLDLGFDSDFEGVDVEPGIAAPFVGLAFDF